MSVKIIQIIATPNDAHYQGAIIGLGDDGVIYLAVNGGWEVHVPLAFIKEDGQHGWLQSYGFYRSNIAFRYCLRDFRLGRYRVDILAF